MSNTDRAGTLFVSRRFWLFPVLGALLLLLMQQLLIGIPARGGKGPSGQGLFHSAARLAVVAAIGKAAVLHQLNDLWEDHINIYRFRVQLQLTHAGSID